MFFVIKILRKTDGTFSNNVFVYADDREARHQFFAIMSTYGNDKSYDYVRALVIDSNGSITRQDCEDHRVASAE